MRQKETTDHEAGGSKGGRTLGLWVVLLTALVLLLGILTMPYVRQYKTVQWVRARGGFVVEIEGTWPTSRLPDAGREWLLNEGWLAERVTVVSLLSTAVTDADLEHLKGMPTLKGLNLTDTRVTGAGFKHFKDMTALKELVLRGTPVTNADLKHLTTMTTLESLDISNTRVTDAGLEHLKGMSLLYLYLGDTQVTDGGLNHLKGMSVLRRLDLSRTLVTRTGMMELEAELPSLEIFY